MIRTLSPVTAGIILTAGCHSVPVADSRPVAAHTRQALGEAYLQAGQYDAARYHFRRILQAEPQHTGALTGMGIVAKCDQKPEISENYLKLAVNSPSGSDTVIQYVQMWSCQPDNSL